MMEKPIDSKEVIRDQEITFLVSEEERWALEYQTDLMGFESVSDFVAQFMCPIANLFERHLKNEN